MSTASVREGVETVSSADRRPEWRERTLRRMLPLAAALLAPPVADAIYRTARTGRTVLLAAVAAAYALLIVAAAWRAGPRAVHSPALLLVPFSVGAIQCLALGRIGDGAVLLLAGVALVVALAGVVAGLSALVLSAFLLGGGAWLGARPSGAHASWAWLSSALTFASSGALIATLVAQMSRQATAVSTEGDDSRALLRTQNRALSQRVGALEEANTRLAGRAEALGALVAIAGQSIAEGGLRELLRRAAALVSQRFGFYHVGIFLVDVTGDWVVLEAASSEGGRRMLARQHRLRVGQEGVVGFVAARGEPRVVLDVEQDALYYQNPDLPETRSEIAVPLVFEGRILGVLDVQDTARAAFRQDDVVLMQTLSELIVVAIQNARAFAELRQAVVAERRSYADLSEQAWLERTSRAGPVAYRFEEGRVSRLGELDEAIGQPGTRHGDLPTLRLPVSVRGRVIGALEAHKPAASRGWSAAEREAMESLVAQLDAALESARLYEDAQALAARERMLAETTARMRETLDVQAVLRTAADEVYRALGLEQVAIRLVEPPDADLPAEGR